MFCINCGAKNKDEARFCITCGKEFKRNEVSSGNTIKMNYIKEELEDEVYVEKDKKSGVSTGTLTLIIVAIVAAIGTGCLTGYKVISDNSKPSVADKDKKSSSTSEEKNTANSKVTYSDDNKDVDKSSSEYILPESDSKFLSSSDLSSFSKEELALARNEIFARYGYVFKSQVYRDYFSSKPWYVEDPSFMGNESELNSFEKANVKLIKSLEEN